MTLSIQKNWTFKIILYYDFVCSSLFKRNENKIKWLKDTFIWRRYASNRQLCRHPVLPWFRLDFISTQMSEKNSTILHFIDRHEIHKISDKIFVIIFTNQRKMIKSVFDVNEMFFFLIHSVFNLAQTRKLVCMKTLQTDINAIIKTKSQRKLVLIHWINSLLEQLTQILYHVALVSHLRNRKCDQQ